MENAQISTVIAILVTQINVYLAHKVTLSIKIIVTNVPLYVLRIAYLMGRNWVV